MVTETLDANVDVIEVALGAEHSCAIDSAGALYAWGRGDEGQLGFSAAADRVLPRRVTALRQRRVLSVRCGVSFCLALDENNSIWSW